jgi:hypothetical protein
VILLRVEWYPASAEAAETTPGLDLAALGEIIDRAGGSIVMDRGPEKAIVSVRLAVAGDFAAERRDVG